MEKQEYWRRYAKWGVTEQWNFELRAHIALNLIERFGAVAADSRGEDSTGRAKLMLQPAKELVQRCFDIADAFVDETERRGALRMTREGE